MKPLLNLRFLSDASQQRPGYFVLFTCLSGVSSAKEQTQRVQVGRVVVKEVRRYMSVVCKLHSRLVDGAEIWLDVRALPVVLANATGWHGISLYQCLEPRFTRHKSSNRDEEEKGSRIKRWQGDGRLVLIEDSSNPTTWTDGEMSTPPQSEGFAG